MPSPSTRSRSSHASLSRSSVTGAALRRGEIKISDPMPISKQASGDRPPHAYDDTPVTARNADRTWPRKSTPPGTHARSGSDGYRCPNNAGETPYDDANRLSLGPSFAQSSMSTVPSKASLTQRNTGLRAAVRRIFGSKRHRLSFSEARKDYYHSDPSNLTSIVEKRPSNPSVVRTPSEPASAVTRGSALGSHSPFATLETLGNSRWQAPDAWQSVQSHHRRRNTLPSVILSEQEAQNFAHTLHQGHDEPGHRTDRFVDFASDGMPKVLKRRSRSANALRELAEGHQGADQAARKLSAEIAYWRTSAVANPAPDYHPRPWQENVLRESARNAQASWVPLGTSKSQDSVQPMQAFEFGLPAGTNDCASLEQRVGTLEIKVVDFEFAIAKLQGHDVSQPSLPSRTPKRRSIHELFPTPKTQGGSSPPDSQRRPSTAGGHACSTPESVSEFTFVTSPITSREDSGTAGEPTRNSRDSKATTIRPSAAQRGSQRRSAAPSPTSGRLTADHFETILALVKEEQAARQLLEGRILGLQQEIDELRAPVYAYIRPAAMPTPSPDTANNSPWAPKARALHRTPAFPQYQRVHIPETSRFSTTDAEESETDDGFEDVYETPQETKFTIETTRTSPKVAMV